MGDQIEPVSSVATDSHLSDQIQYSGTNYS